MGAKLKLCNNNLDKPHRVYKDLPHNGGFPNPGMAFMVYHLDMVS